ncbi:MAG TPA: TolC family protein [Candidatus Limnocylindria bacterium]|nr:TolC family protein [Candidatus Limnocylindria bacterium]
MAHAVTRGLAVSEEAKLASSQTREAATGVSVALSGVLPEVNGQFQYTRTIRTLFSIPGFANIPLPLGQANGYNMAVAVSQPIYRPGAMRGIQIAKDYLKSAKDQESESRLDLVLRICQSYYDTVLADSLAAISQAQVDQLEAQLHDVQLQRKAGNASDLDVLRVQVNRDNIAPQLVAVINARDDALFALRQLLNIEKNTDLVLADQLSADGFQPVSELELETLVHNALETRASVRSAKRTTVIRESQIKQARAAYYPSLDAVGQLGEQAYPADFFPNNRDFIDNWSVGFQINIPLWSSGRRKAQLRAAQERAKQSWLELELVKESVESQAEEARRELRRSADLVATRTRTTSQAAKVFQLTELAYKQGVAGHLELDDARLNLRQSRSNETQAVHDYYLFYLRLLRVVGVPAEAFTSANSLSSHRQTIGKQPGTP